MMGLKSLLISHSVLIFFSCLWKPLLLSQKEASWAAAQSNLPKNLGLSLLPLVERERGNTLVLILTYFSLKMNLGNSWLHLHVY